MPVAITLIVSRLDDAPPADPYDALQGPLLRSLRRLLELPDASPGGAPFPGTLSPVHLADPSGTGTSRRGCPDRRKDAGETHVRLRLSWLEDAHRERLLGWAEGTETAPVPLGTNGLRARIVAARTRPAPGARWNGAATYAELHAGASDSLRTAALKFCSPTLLDRAGRPYPLPDPATIFGRYLDLWNRFSGIALDPQLPRALRESLLLSDFRIRPRALPSAGAPSLFFSGSAVFELGGRHPETVLRGFNALADYAFYCGTGTETERGKGWTRRILPGTRPTGTRGRERSGLPRHTDPRWGGP